MDEFGSQVLFLNGHRKSREDSKIAMCLYLGEFDVKLK